MPPDSFGWVARLAARPQDGALMARPPLPEPLEERVPRPGNRRYVNGAAFERRVKAKLEADGWTVWRTPGSKSPADLVCVRGMFLWSRDDGTRAYEPRVALVQCKGGVTKITRAKRAQFKQFAGQLGADAYIATRGLKLERA